MESNDLAIQRTKLANQRTYLAYMRTGFAVLGWLDYLKNGGLLFLVFL